MTWAESRGMTSAAKYFSKNPSSSLERLERLTCSILRVASWDIILKYV